jgi:hypothetical protein
MKDCGKTGETGEYSSSDMQKTEIILRDETNSVYEKKRLNF